jgi:hypothetical protein
MKLKITLSLLAIPLVMQANMYQKDLQVFTVNTAEKKCTTPLTFVYKGDREGYAKEILKDSTELSRIFLHGAGVSTSAMAAGGSIGQSLAGGLATGLAVGLIQGAADAVRNDFEYLYVTECNSGENRTRLMTLVVSNDKLTQEQVDGLAKEDQARSK